MPRFWAKVFPKKSSVSAYHDQLVRAEELRKRGDAHARMWCEELDRVCEHGCRVLAGLETDLCALTQCIAAEPALLPSLRRAQYCVSTHLNYAWKSDGDRWNQEREKVLDAYLCNLQDRLVFHQAVDECEWTALKRVCRLERDLFMCKHYLDSQLELLQQQPMTMTQETRWQRVEKIQCLWADLQARFARLLFLNTPLSSTRSFMSTIPQAEDFTCAICLCVYSEPVTLSQCQHTFCCSCLRQYVTTAFSSSSASNTDMPALSCPLCRSPFEDTPAAWFPNLDLSHFLSLYLPTHLSDHTDDSNNNRNDGTTVHASLAPRSRPRSRPRSAIGAALNHFSQKWHPHFPERRTPSPRLISRPTSLHQDRYDLNRRSWML